MKIALFSQDINKDVETVFQSILSHEEATKCNFFIFKNLRNSVAKTDQGHRTAKQFYYNPVH